MTTPTESRLPHEPARSPLRAALRSLAKLMRSAATRDELLASTAILTAQLESTLDGILVIDREGRIVSYNRRFLEIWRIPEEVAATGGETDLFEHAVKTVEGSDSLDSLASYVDEHHDGQRTDDTITLDDGRVLSRTSVPIVVNGAFRGRSWYFRDVTDPVRSERLKSALFRIAELSRESESLDALYAAVHSISAELMNARNFFIAIYDREHDLLSFPYFVDEHDKPLFPIPPGRGLTAYVLRTGRPLLASPEAFGQLVADGEVEAMGTPSIDWLGAPLKSGGRVWGVIGTQSYDESVRYTEADLEVLVFVAGQVASAIGNKRKDDALRASERRYRHMFERNPAIKMLIDPQSGKIIDANQSACDYFGQRREELTARSISDLAVSSERDLRRHVEDAYSRKKEYFEFHTVRADGSVRAMQVQSGPLELSGRSVLYSILSDVTDRKEVEEQYRVIFDYAPVGIYQSTVDGEFITANAALARMLGYASVEDLLQQNLQRDIYLEPVRKQEDAPTFAPFEYAAGVEAQWKKKSGTPIWVQVSARATRSASGEVYVEGFVYDITSRKRAEEMLRKHSAAMTASMDGIGILNDRLEFTYANDSLANLFGFPGPHSLIGLSLCDLYEPQEQVRFITSIIPVVQQRGRWRGEATGLRRDGAIFPQEISLTAVGDGSVVCVVRDVTERTYAEEQIKHLAYHDALTSLPNRLLFKDRLTVALSHAQRDGSRLAVLFLDLDRFKIINDSLGHNIGDQLLQAVSARVQSCVRESDTVARLGGDEFIVLLPNLRRADEAAPVAMKILEAIRYPLHVEGREFFMTTSIGISLFPEDGSDAETLIKNADTSMYQAKEMGRDNYQMYNAIVNAKTLQRIALEHGLRRALANDELSVVYQPIIDLRNGRISGVEALLRWDHQQMGSIPPSTFIPLAESTGVMQSIGVWALEQACRQARIWHDTGYPTLSLAVNLSVTQLQQFDLVNQVRTILAETRLPSRLLELEITESVAMHSPEQSIRTLYDLKKMGIRISLDDFGTGHSSLSYLKRFPIDTVKIDQSFVHDITSEPDTAAIVTAIIAMAHSLRLKVVAEGVEYAEQENFLRRHGCDLMQGFLITEPVPAAALSAILARTHSTGSPQQREPSSQ
jgi:diguanylate cyclase (GGDEF)-like protein/PAS domain S-box-containing protein